MTRYWYNTNVNGLHKGLRLALLASLLITFLLAQAAQAADMPEAAARIQIPAQQVDIDGDGRADNFAMDATVYSDGTVRVDPYKNFKFLIKFDGATVSETDDGFRGSLTGTQYEFGDTATHEVGHWLGLYHQHTAADGSSYIVFDVVDGYGNATTFTVLGTVEALR